MNLKFLEKNCVERVTKAKKKVSGVKASLIYVDSATGWKEGICKTVPTWMKADVNKKQSWLHSFTDNKGLVRILTPPKTSAGTSQRGQFGSSSYALARDFGGTVYRELSSQEVSEIVVEFIGSNEDELKGLMAGLEIASHSYKESENSPKITLNLGKSKNTKVVSEQGFKLGKSVNLARYLVNMPPCDLNPKSYAELVKSIFSKSKKTKVEVWNEARLKKEKMGLHIAVGQSAEQTSQLVMMKYRGDSKSKKKYSFVGKGITFDSGGLDIKPASGMRNMKKDMGGSASVVGLAHWLDNSGLKINVDFYIALAENSIAGNSFRPGDILHARNGLSVEIHNTDAEGRLVLADALTIAAESKPEWIINLATLTGAIKVGLGASVAGLFTNDDSLAQDILKCSAVMGEGLWQMPLVPSERKRLRSDIADLVNCTDGYGGAVTAALFLENFVNKVPWVHCDIYSWADRAEGAISHKGGNGQLVQSMANFLESL